jgi:hypothetical protein
MESQEIATFQDGVAAILMSTEEIRQAIININTNTQPVTADHILLWRHELEGLLNILGGLQPSDDIENDLRKHCHNRVAGLLVQVLQRAVTKDEPNSDDDLNSELEKDCQGAIARMAELVLMLNSDNNKIQETAIDSYVSYQRQVLRKRAKPSIARLVARRKLPDPKWVVLEQEDDDDEEEDAESSSSQHAHVITTILGQASALIHPLLLWKSNLPPEIPLYGLCTKAIQVLDEQAQTLVQTVATWFLEDRQVDEWMAPSAQLSQDPDSSSSPSQPSASHLAQLDGLVEELAFLCQVCARYIALVQGETLKTYVLAKELQPEWTWKYASLERYLATQQWQSALQLASPVSIVLGTSIQVPSVVEDAQYLSTRALERAASTGSTQAIGTVAYSIAADVWSTELSGGVHQALMDQQGCYVQDSPEMAKKDTSTTATVASAPKSGSSFASALLGALDDDLPSTSSKQLPNAPPSGTFLGSLSSFGVVGGDKLSQIRLDTQLCALNGVHSASVACSSLVQFLDSLLPKEEIQQDTQAASMIQLAREELFRFAATYKQLLQTQVQQVVQEWCGSLHDAPVYKGLCIPVLRYNLERQRYDLPDTAALQKSEDDAVLEKLWIHPLQESKLLQQLAKCDADVLNEICQALSSLLGDLILDSIRSKTTPKRFTDWGSLLFSKQVRLVQNYISRLLETASQEDEATASIMPMMAPSWERLNQAVAVLQLEKPSDWGYYQATSALKPEELQSLMRLRADFSNAAIRAVVASVTATNTSNAK